MIKKLRVKFIVLSMVSLFLVLTVIMVSVNFLNYREIVRDADDIISILEDNGGTFPKMDDFKGNGRGKGKGGPISPETRFETRHFSVRLDESGNVIMVDTGKIAAVDTSTAIEFARDILNRGSKQGFIEVYRYQQLVSGNEIQVIFVDCGRSLSTFRKFLVISCGISLAGMLAVLILIILFSGRIIKPVSESYEKQKRFITDAGHEIKTPLAIIEADADVLEMDVGENEWLVDIRKQTSRLAELTNSLICLSRMEEGHNRFQMIDFPISDVVHETVQSFQSLAQTQKKEFVSQIQPMLSLCGDEKALRQLITILLDNALKYSPEGGTILLELEKQGKTVRLTVFNTAEAVSGENLEHIFERFYRADASRNSQTGGYGIGLSIAQAIVTAHKGKITASTKDGQSLLITVALPV